MDARRQMLELLDRKVFGPAMHADPHRYPAELRDDVVAVKRAAREARDSYHRYESPEHIKSMFQDMLDSPYGREQTAELRSLGLPAFPDVADDFMDIVVEHHIS